MFRLATFVMLAFCIEVISAVAQEIGSANGKGTMERSVPPDYENSEMVSFSPRYSYAYSEDTDGKKFTWIVLTEKEPPVETLMAAKDAVEARRSWCETEKTSFVAVKLDPNWKVDLYYRCPGDGGTYMEMLNTINGLESIVVKFDVRDEKRLKGTLTTGNGNCPDENGVSAYCTPTGDYEFDAFLVN